MTVGLLACASILFRSSRSIFALAALSGGLVPAYAELDRSNDFTLEIGLRRAGWSLGAPISMPKGNAKACAAACRNNPACQGYTYEALPRKSPVCHLFGGGLSIPNQSLPNICCTSGVLITRLDKGNRLCIANQCLNIDDMVAEMKSRLAGRAVGYSFMISDGRRNRGGSGGFSRTNADPPRHPYTILTRSNPASVSKTLTAIAALRVLEKNNIPIDAPIHTYLPGDWKIPDKPEFRGLTFRHLFTHRSGLDELDYKGGPDDITYESLKAFMEGKKGKFDLTMRNSGTYKYQNAHYALLRVLIGHLADVKASNLNRIALQVADITQEQRDAGMAQFIANAFVSYMNAHVFLPAGITRKVECKPDYSNPFVKAPPLNFPLPAGNARGFDQGDFSLYCGSTGLYLSVNELVAILKALRRGKLLSDTQQEAMWKGLLGWQAVGTNHFQTQAASHGGFAPGPIANWDRPGADYSEILLNKNEGSGACLRRCAEDARCKAFTFVKEGIKKAFQPVCYLKNAVPSRTQNPCCVSGVMFDLKDNKNLPGHQLGAPIDLRDGVNDYISQCRRLCANNAKCRAFVATGPGYDGQKRARCHLKSTTPKPEDRPCCVTSGLKGVTWDSEPWQILNTGGHQVPDRAVIDPRWREPRKPVVDLPGGPQKSGPTAPEPSFPRKMSTVGFEIDDRGQDLNAVIFTFSTGVHVAVVINSPYPEGIGALVAQSYEQAWRPK